MIDADTHRCSPRRTAVKDPPVGTVAVVSTNFADDPAMVRQPDIGKFDGEMLMKIRVVLDEHSKECTREPKAILLNPGNHALLGWDEVLGLPVLPDERAEPMRARLVCGAGRAGYCEEGEVIWDEDGGAYVFVAEEKDQV
jgi:hypothetical protein